jgi:tRNA threonylcarbamoyladenosine biosynthesis protein TsaE
MLSSEAETIAFGAALANAIGEQGAVIYLDGDLGAGKTTLSRGLVRAFGHSGAVKSPTYTLVEPYELSDKSIYHFDLYRLSQPEELYYLGVEDYLQKPAAVCLFEWSMKGRGEIPPADLTLQLAADSCESHQHRTLAMTTCSDRGRTILQNLADTYAVLD